jgi:serine protease AprX
MKTTMSCGSRGISLRQPLCGIVTGLLLMCGALSPASAAKQTAQTTAKVAVDAPAANLDKLSVDLRPLVTSPGTVPVDAAWAKSSNGQVLVKVLIVGASTDAELTSLRADLLARGGSVFYNYVSVRALSAMLPTSALAVVAARSDVLTIAPNRATQRQASLVQTVSGAGDALPGAGTASALDGRGVGIAVLDSGIDFRHRNLLGADGKSRVRASVDFVAMGRMTFLDGGWTGGRDYSPMIKSLTAAYFTWTGGANAPLFAKEPDAYGHGTAVASVAAGAGSYQAPDSSGIATGADVYDVRVLNEQGVGNLADVLAGIDWVIQRSKLANIRVMNMSLGAASTDSFLVDPLARAARSATAAGIVVVVSAGNAGKDDSGREVYGTVSSPGHEPTVITVGASNMLGTAKRSDDVMTTFSSRGPTRGSLTFANGNRWTDNLIKPDLVAPGNKLLTASGADSSGTAEGLNLLAHRRRPAKR